MGKVYALLCFAMGYYLSILPFSWAIYVYWDNHTIAQMQHCGE